MKSSIQKTFKTYGGYFLLVAWFGALGGLGYFAHVTSQDARTELLGDFLPSQSRVVEVPIVSPAAAVAEQGLGDELRTRLSTGLDTLTDILKDLQTKTASAAGDHQ